MLWIVLTGVIAVALRHHHRAAAPLKFATFNIEEFPQSDRQIEGAFAELVRLDAGFVAVQEISDARVFAAEMRQRLGDDWRFVQAEPEVRFDLGVLYDTRRFTLVSSAVHGETRLGGRNKPVLEARLARVAGGAIVRVLVAHFKSGTDGRNVRARQYVALAGIVRAAKQSGERVVVLGDFNATADADRTDLAALAATAGLAWATEPLACTAFWSRDDGCPRSRLDHVLTWATPATVEAAGACATDGCEWQDRCPRYVEHVSDHCPVVVTIDQ